MSASTLSLFHSLHATGRRDLKFRTDNLASQSLTDWPHKANNAISNVYGCRVSDDKPWPVTCMTPLDFGDPCVTWPVEFTAVGSAMTSHDGAVTCMTPLDFGDPCVTWPVDPLSAVSKTASDVERRRCVSQGRVETPIRRAGQFSYRFVHIIFCYRFTKNS